MQMRRDFLLSGCMALFGNRLQGSGDATRSDCSNEHTVWVEQVLKRMQTIQIGMTREALLKVFTTEGGLSFGLQRTYVSQDCLYFKVKVHFAAVGRPQRDRDGRETTVENPKDLITFISEPFLQFSIMD